MLNQHLQTLTCAALAALLTEYAAGGDAYAYVAAEISFREIHPEYRVG